MMSAELVRAVEANDNSTVTMLLSNQPWLINQVLDDHEGALHKAVFQGYVDLVDLLVHLGADINIRSLIGRTPLHIGADYGKIQCAEYLLAQNAAVNVVDLRGFTPLFYAARAGSSNSRRVAELLLTSGATLDLNSALRLGLSDRVRDYLRSTPDLHSALAPAFLLEDAIASGSVEFVELILDRGFDPNIPAPGTGAPPLFSALSGVNPNLDIVRLLVQRGADVQARDSSGDSILAWVHETSAPGAIQLLKELGASE